MTPSQQLAARRAKKNAPPPVKPAGPTRRTLPKYASPLMLIASKQPIGEVLAQQEECLWWWGFDSVMKGECRGTALPAFTRILLRLAFMAGYAGNDKLAQRSRSMVEAWLSAADRCDAKGLRHITLTAAEAATMKSTFNLMAIALPQLPFDAYAQAEQRIALADMEDAA